MHELILWCGFVGAWLLFAGPVYQAVLELQAEGLEFERLGALRSTLTAPPPVSNWWWLVPPVRYVLGRRRSNRYQNLLIDAMTDDDYEALDRFRNKAFGWFYVGGGGLLIAGKETYELVEGLEWPTAVFWLLGALMVALSIGNAAGRVANSKRIRRRRIENAAAR
jgi:hypothetical protein